MKNYTRKLNFTQRNLEKKSLEYFYSFENREAIFADIHKSYKFTLMLIKTHH
ncbi:hypothetical protein OLP40_08255 [Campylobacter jejuni]|nr:hypothetical protein [Campylobacter jejuni]HDZ4937520.1 hypothetical protein [Campylobacter jejuni]HDZ4943521.1 hypothetical protein [Campylobacter jejuni]HDZ4945653.1 hypothetical protein [Campylobacter jejuni]HDZ4952477.1 hypothetical protein [Campylobacter jejuni]